MAMRVRARVVGKKGRSARHHIFKTPRDFVALTLPPLYLPTDIAIYVNSIRRAYAFFLWYFALAENLIAKGAHLR